MMGFINVVLSACLLTCALALPGPAGNPTFISNEIKFDGSADWSRIVGGSPASSGQFPYIASLRRSTTNSHFCGASIVSSVYLISAAHCTIDNLPSSITAVVGTTTLNSGGTAYSIENIINHPNYNTNRGTNDISLLRTTSPITGSSLVASIPISSATIGGEVEVTLSGWGRLFTEGTLPNNLQFINLRTISNNDCAQRHAPDPIYDTELCTFTQAGEGTCFGDSGGPLVANGALVGLVTWGVPCAVGFPDAFTRVSSYITWIQENAV